MCFRERLHTILRRLIFSTEITKYDVIYITHLTDKSLQCPDGVVFEKNNLYILTHE